MRVQETEIEPYDGQIVGFFGERLDIRGYIDLYTTFGEGKHLCRTIKIRYLIVEANTSYNILLGKLFLTVLREIITTPHLAMKFSSASEDIATVHVDRKIARECYVTSLRVEHTNREES